MYVGMQTHVEEDGCDKLLLRCHIPLLYLRHFSRVIQLLRCNVRRLKFELAPAKDWGIKYHSENSTSKSTIEKDGCDILPLQRQMERVLRLQTINKLFDVEQFQSSFIRKMTYLFQYRFVSGMLRNRSPSNSHVACLNSGVIVHSTTLALLCLRN